MEEILYNFTKSNRKVAIMLPFGKFTLNMKSQQDGLA
jgi:hypothetical protein